MPARTVQPYDSHPVAFFQMCNARSKRGHDASAFMTRCERKAWLDWLITVGGMQVGVTNSAGDDFHESLPWSRRKDGEFSNHQRRAKFLDDGCFHFFWNGHGWYLLK